MSLSISFCVCVFSLVDPVESAKNIHLCLTCIHEHLHTLKQFRVVQQGANTAEVFIHCLAGVQGFWDSVEEFWYRRRNKKSS